MHIVVVNACPSVQTANCQLTAPAGVLDKGIEFFMPYMFSQMGPRHVSISSDGILQDMIGPFGMSLYRNNTYGEIDPNAEIPPSNVVLNPSFEVAQAAISKPYAWREPSVIVPQPEPQPSGTFDMAGTLMQDSRYFRTGRVSGRYIFGFDYYNAMASIAIHGSHVDDGLQAGTTYEISLWARTSIENATLKMCIYTLNPLETGPSLQLGEPLKQLASAIALSTQEWRNIKLTATPSVSGGLVMVPSTSAVFWVDDVSVIKG